MKQTVLYLYALLDKAGKSRGTCTATSVTQARQVLLRARRGAKFPPGYYIVRRGPAPVPEVCAPPRDKVKDLLTEAHASLKAANTENQELRRKLDVTDEILVKTLDGRDYLRARVDELRKERHYLKEFKEAQNRTIARMTEANRDRIKREAEEIVATLLSSQAAHIERQLEGLLDDRRAAGIPQLPIDHAPMSVAVDILRLLAQEYCPTNPKPKGEKA